MERPPKLWTHLLSACGILTLFVIDLASPLDLVVVYLTIPFLLFRTCREETLYAYGAAITLLIVVEFAHSTPTDNLWQAAMSRCLGIAVQWIAIAFLARYKVNEELLRLREKRYRHLYSDTPVMLHSIDECGCLISVSNFWLEQMGYGGTR